MRDTVRTVLTAAATAALVAAVAAPAAPGPAPAPPGSSDPTLAQRVALLEDEASDSAAGVWDWRRFQDCIHDAHVRASTRPNAAVPVTWKTQCLVPTERSTP
jgi:hypothetical protein